MESDIDNLIETERLVGETVSKCLHIVAKQAIFMLEMEKRGLRYLPHEQVRAYAAALGAMDYLAGITPRP